MKKILNTLKTTTILLILAGMMISCGKEKENNEEWTNATIIDLGNPAVDGCGWAVQIGETISIPDFLDEEYKQNGLQVGIIYNKTAEIYQCPGFSNFEYDRIIINKIKKIQP
ncbi:MAG: hypothetical protein LBS69_02380 [Prevotellaceae bacterium]|nr:hypothetical protein [Prevotellaceae bacterium]